jgi:hypothetical protein
MSDKPPLHEAISARSQTQESPSFCVTIDTPEGLSILILRENQVRKSPKFSTHSSPRKFPPRRPPARTQQAFVNQPTTSTPSFPHFSFLVTPHT